MTRTLKIGTRKSPMALAQTKRVVETLEKHHAGIAIETVPLVTTGDRWMGDLRTRGGKGDAFVKEIERALLDGEIDMAMHSMKDVPGNEGLPRGLVIPCMLERDDARDALVCRVAETGPDLGPRARVGSSSVRRRALLTRHFPRWNLVPIRGNLNTRLKKLEKGEVDGLIVALAGLERIGFLDRLTKIFEFDVVLPAIGQGAVGVECRNEDAELKALLENINHHPTHVRVSAERAMLQALDGHCNSPIAGHCALGENGRLHLTGLVMSPDGETLLRTEAEGDFEDPSDLGQRAAGELLHQGAAEIIAASRP